MRFSKITRGFSLFELLVVLTLVAIMIDLVCPSWRHLFNGASSQALLEQLSQTLNFARQEAGLRQTLITVCGSRDQETCSTSWENGFLVFIDPKQEGRVEEPNQILRIVSVGRSVGVLHWRAFPRNQQSCQFLPSGTTNHENGTFWYCDSVGQEPAWALALSQSGRLRVIYPDRRGKVRDDKGLLLPC